MSKVNGDGIPEIVDRLKYFMDTEGEAYTVCEYSSWKDIKEVDELLYNYIVAARLSLSDLRSYLNFRYPDLTDY